jgi:hypothetical protein
MESLTTHPAGPLTYLFGVLFTDNFVLIFITTILLLAADFYYLKNIAGRRLVGLRWWNEANASTGDSHWVFESAPQPNEPGGKVVTPTDKRFFWIALYAQPAFWAALAIVAIVRFKFIWLTLVGMLQRIKSGTITRSQVLTCLQSLLLSSPSQTPLLSRDATSSARLAESWREASTVVLWPGTLVEPWFLGCSAGARSFALLVSSA